MDCVNCRQVAPSLCTYHIMDLSGCAMDDVEMVSEETLWVYYCPYCGNSVLTTKFCRVCYIYSDPAALMQWLVDAPQWRCEDCGAPKIIGTTQGQDICIGPCGRCLRQGFTVITPLTPEQLAAWVKGIEPWTA